MLNQIPHVIYKVDQIIREDNHIFIIPTYPHYNIWSGFYISKEDHIPIALNSFYCVTKGSFEIGSTVENFPSDITTGFEFKLYTDELQYISVIYELYRINDVEHYLTILSQTHPKTYRNVIQYAVQYNMTKILNTLPDRMKRIINITLSTNHRM